MPEEPDPLASIAKGVAKGTYEHAEEKIKVAAVAIADKIQYWIKKFRQGELAFIEDEKTIEVVRNQRKKPSWKLFRRYVKDPDLRLQIEMGLSLKALEENKKNREDLRRKILNRYGTKGLHLAELSQRGLIDRYLWLLLDETQDEQELRDGIEDLLKNVDRYVEFVQAEQDIERQTKAIITRLRAFKPKAMILLCKGTQAEENAREMVDDVSRDVEGYRIEIMENVTNFVETP